MRTENRQGAVSVVDVLYVLLAGWRWLSAGVAGNGMDTAAMGSIWTDAAMYFTFRCFFYGLSLLPGRWSRLLPEILLVGGLALVGSIELRLCLRQILGQAVSKHSLFLFTGSQMNPGPLGGLLSVVAAVMLAWLLSAYSSGALRRPASVSQLFRLVLAAWVLAVFSACLILLPSTMSRAAWLALAVAAAVVLLPALRERLLRLDKMSSLSQKKKRLSLLAAWALVLLLAAGAWQLKPRSAAGRLYIDRISLRIMAAHPWTGTGPGTYAGAYGMSQESFFRERLPSWDSTSEDFLSGLSACSEASLAGCPEYAFNEYLQTGAESGLPALLLMSALTITAIVRLLRRESAGGAGLAALCVFSLFSYPYALPHFRVMSAAFLALAATCPATTGHMDPAKRRIRLVTEAGVCISFLALGICWLLFDRIPAERARKEVQAEWRQLRTWYSCGDYGLVAEHYPALLEKLPCHPGMLFEYGRSLHLTGDHRRAIEVLEQGMSYSSDPMFLNVTGNCYKSLAAAVPDSADFYYQQAEQAYRRAFMRLPNRLYPLYLLAKLYDERNMGQDFLRTARVVAGFPVRVGSPAINDMKREIDHLAEKYEQ